jgi:hypothetical protein
MLPATAFAPRQLSPVRCNTMRKVRLTMLKEWIGKSHPRGSAGSFAKASTNGPAGILAERTGFKVIDLVRDDHGEYINYAFEECSG